MLLDPVLLSENDDDPKEELSSSVIGLINRSAYGTGAADGCPTFVTGAADDDYAQQISTSRKDDDQLHVVSYPQCVVVDVRGKSRDIELIVTEDTVYSSDLIHRAESCPPAM